MNNKIFPRNLTAQAAYTVPGNPPSTRPESGVANCYPGLEYDHRNLDRRFFPGLIIEYVSQVDASSPQGSLQGARLVVVDTADPELRTHEPRYQERAVKLVAQLRGGDGGRLGAPGTQWFIESINQGGKKIACSGTPKGNLDGTVVWRLIRGLRPEEVTITLSQRQQDATKNKKDKKGKKADHIVLEGWRRHFTDEQTGVISLAYQSGELTQSLCSPWMHDFRDCSCTYWASNHPDLVFPEASPADEILPSGSPAGSIPGETRINWLRSRTLSDAVVSARPSQNENRPYEMNHFEINRQWQDLAIVLENREISRRYLPRSGQTDNAKPFASPEELRDQLIILGGLEHLVALLYLYARYSIITPEEAQKKVRQNTAWQTLPDDVEFVRHHLLEVAISEMQHLRWVNHLLWGIAEANLISGWTYEPDVLKPLLEIPGSDKIPTQAATLSVLDIKTLQLFIDIEEPSGYIDGRYARATATLLQSPYPSHLYQMASSIARDGEQHFLHFRNIQLVLSRYGNTNLPYLRSLTPGDPEDATVQAALGLYKNIIAELFQGYQLGNPLNQGHLASARGQMIELDTIADRLGGRNIGIPFLSLFQST